MISRADIAKLSPSDRRAALQLAEEMERREEAQRLARVKAECEESFIGFVRNFWHVLEPATPLVEGWMLEALCRTLEAVSDGHILRAIINVPPGSGKSLLLNCFWPAWEWGPQNRPWTRYIAASFNVALPERDNDRFATLISHSEYQAFWSDRVTLRLMSKTLVENDRTGWKRVTSTHGGTTGLRGDKILIDDANNPNDVESDAVRAATTHWLTEVMPDRLSSLETGVIINLQQRTHARDATGVLADLWEEPAWVLIPMEYDPDVGTPVVLRRDEHGRPTEVWRDPRGLDENGDDLVGRMSNGKVAFGSPLMQATGTLCWPERFSPERVYQLKKEKGPYAWAGQYQQLPTVRGGNIIRREWWQLWEPKKFPEFGTIIVSVDTNLSDGEESDYCAATTWGAFAHPKTGAPQLMLIYAWRDRPTFPELVTRIAENCRGRTAGGQQPWEADYLIIENKGRGCDVTAEIKRQYSNARWQTLALNVPARMDKAARLQALTSLFSGDVVRDPVSGMDVWQGGIIWAPNTDWAENLVIEEVCNFPKGQHDDITDTVSQAVAWVRRNGVVVRKVEHEIMEEDEMRYTRPLSVPYAIGGG